MKSKKISILSALAIIVYCLMVTFSFIDDWADFKRGFIQGYNKSNGLYSNEDYDSSELFFLSLETRNHIFTFPDTLTNTKDGKKYPVIISNAKLEFPKSEVPKKVKTYYAIGLFLSFILLTCYIAIPILFISIMRSIGKDVIFTRQNIKYITWLGVFLLGVFCVDFIIEIISHLSNKMLFDFSDYILRMSFPDFLWGLLGVITLLIGEILRKAIVLKEEQDLTI